jgi:hypothetical protein
VKESYTVKVVKNNKEKDILIYAFDANHAQAQASDIRRSLQADSIQLNYGSCKKTKLSELFNRLAFSDFSHKKCCEWEGSFVNSCPAIYILGERYYIRPLVLEYMDMNRDNFVKMSCGNNNCINPYHNAYKANKASKLTGGDLQMVVAYRSQGVSIPQIAEVLNVHRSTIYRKLSNECLRSRPANHSKS